MQTVFKIVSIQKNFRGKAPKSKQELRVSGIWYVKS